MHITPPPTKPSRPNLPSLCSSGGATFSPGNGDSVAWRSPMRRWHGRIALPSTGDSAAAALAPTRPNLGGRGAAPTRRRLSGRDAAPPRDGDSVAGALANSMKTRPTTLASTRRRLAGRGAATMNRLPHPRDGDSAATGRDGVRVSVE